MKYKEVNDFYDLTRDFLWGLQSKWDVASLKQFVQKISDDFSFEIDWDEGIENWAALHGKKESDFILLNCRIPFVFAHKSLCGKFEKYPYVKVLFFNNYNAEKIFLPKEIIGLCFDPSRQDIAEIQTIADFIYETYT